MKIQIKHGVIALMLITGVAVTIPVASAAQDAAGTPAEDTAGTPTPDAYGGELVKEVLYTDSAASSPGETLALVR